MKKRSYQYCVKYFRKFIIDMIEPNLLRLEKMFGVYSNPQSLVQNNYLQYGLIWV